METLLLLFYHASPRLLGLRGHRRLHVDRLLFIYTVLAFNFYAAEAEERRRGGQEGEDLTLTVM